MRCYVVYITGMRIVECAVRVSMLESVINKFYKNLLIYKNNPTDVFTKRKLKVSLSGSYAFAAFKDNTLEIIRKNMKS